MRTLKRYIIRSGETMQVLDGLNRHVEVDRLKHLHDLAQGLGFSPTKIGRHLIVRLPTFSDETAWDVIVDAQTPLQVARVP